MAMEFKVIWHDPDLSNVLLYERPKRQYDLNKGFIAGTEIARTGEFWVPQAPLSQVKGQSLDFTVTKTGDMVRIPLFSYHVPASMSVLLGFGMQIAIAAMTELRKHTPDVPHTAVMVIGRDCPYVSDVAGAANQFRCFVGLALQTK
jgi:hypothetical protein